MDLRGVPMPITDIAVTDIANFADGHEFGAAGAYVRIKGVARGTLDPAAPRANGGLGAEFPATLENGEPIIGRIRDEFHFGTRAPGDGSVRRLSYPAASIDQKQARLTVRARESDPRTEIPRGKWEFIDDRSIRLLPDGSSFEPIKIYELWYEATGPKVLGIGYASV